MTTFRMDSMYASKRKNNNRHVLQLFLRENKKKILITVCSFKKLLLVLIYRHLI